MADMEKRIARFIEPFRVNPGLEREAGEGLRSRVQGGDREEGGRSGAVGRRHRAALGLPGAPGGAGHPRRPGGASGPRRRRKGRDDPARDEWRQPQGVRVESFKVPSAASSIRTSSAATRSGCRRGARSAIFNRSHYEEVLVVRVHPGEPRRARSSRPRRASITSGHAGTKRSTTGSGISPRTGFRIVKIFLNLSKEEQRVRFLRRIDLPEHNWKFSFHDVEERRSLGRLPGRVLGDVQSHEHRVGAVVRDPGRPQVVCAHRGRAR